MRQTDDFPGFQKFFYKKTKKHEPLTIIVLERNETAFSLWRIRFVSRTSKVFMFLQPFFFSDRLLAGLMAGSQ